MAILPDITPGLEEITELVVSVPGAMRKFGLMAIKTIIARTKSGKDRHGIVFPAYHPRYIRFRERHGLKPAPVDLTSTGTMLGSLAVLDGTDVSYEAKGQGSKIRGGGGRFAAASDVRIQIGFTDPLSDTLAGIHRRGTYGGHKRKPRDFMGITEDENSVLFAEFDKRLHKMKDTTVRAEITLGLG